MFSRAAKARHHTPGNGTNTFGPTSNEMDGRGTAVIQVRRRTLAKLLLVVFVGNLVVMGAGAWYSYQQAPPIPQEFVGPDGETVVTDDGIREGKTVFQSDALMNHGSILGNGAYFGSDYTADALDRKVQYMRAYYAEERYGSEYDSLTGAEQAAVDDLVESDLASTDTTAPVECSAAEVYAHQQVRADYVERYHEGSREHGLPAGTIESADEARQFADFALWTAWISHTERPGSDHTYTNDWPYAPIAGNEPTAGTMTWSVIAMVLLVAGAGVGVWLYTPQTNIVVTEFWRWWVVHMWVEGAFEFFIVAIVGITLVSMNLLKRRSAEKAVMFQALFVMGSGVIGVSHHYWWIGQPDVWIPFGSVFSTLKLVPLVLILFEAINEYRALATAGESSPYSLPFAFIIASGFWNFVGAGVLGFFINLPIINYYEHGTSLTVGHAHAAMFGAFGVLALGMVTYMLRIAVDPGQWTPKRLKLSFWPWNVGLGVMVFGSVLPVGFLQLETAFTANYDAARSLAFYNRDLIQLLFWARLPGDTMIILGTAVFAYDTVLQWFALRDTSIPASVPGSSVIPSRVLPEDD